MACSGAGRGGEAEAEGSLDRVHRGAVEGGEVRTEAKGAGQATGVAGSEKEEDGVIVAERIRDEHTQLRFEVQDSPQAGPTAVYQAVVAATATEPTPLAPATPTAEPVPETAKEPVAYTGPEIVMIEEEDHHDLAQLRESAAMGELAVEPANASTTVDEVHRIKECKRSLTFKLGGEYRERVADL